VISGGSTVVITPARIPPFIEICLDRAFLLLIIGRAGTDVTFGEWGGTPILLRNWFDGAVG
jgi:hypothetical protein